MNLSAVGDIIRESYLPSMRWQLQHDSLLSLVLPAVAVEPEEPEFWTWLCEMDEPELDDDYEDW